MLNNKHNSRLNGWERCSQPFFFGDIKTGLDGGYGSFGGKTEEHVVFERQENMRTCCCFKDIRTREHVVLRHENKRTCCCFEDIRTREHVFFEDMRT